jgi:hypothetical protein
MPSLTKVQSGFMEAQGALPLSSGTAAAPGLKFDDHAGTGMFSPSTGEIAFSTSSHQQALTLDTAGRLGIGASNNTSYDTNAQTVLIASGGNTGMTIRSAGSTPFAMIHFADGTTDNSQKRAGRIMYQHDGDNLTFHTANEERFRVNGSGRLTSTRSTTTAYNAAATTNDSNVVILNSGVAGHATLQFQSLSGGTANTGQATISATSEGASTKNTVLTFGTRQNSDSTVRERLRITSAGKLLVGSTITSNSAAIQGFSAHGNTAGESGIVTVDTNAMATGVGGEISFYGKTDGTATPYNYLAHIRGIKENATNTNTASALTFHTRPTLTAPQERLRITSGGNVGINDLAPSEKLNVGGNIMLEGDNQFMYLCNQGTGNAGIYVRGYCSGATSNHFLRSHSTNMFTWEVTGQELMRLTSDGDVGIGDTSPNNSYGTNLSVHNTATNGARIKISDGTSGKGNLDGLDIIDQSGVAYFIQRENNSMRFSTNNVERLRIASDGKIAIGGNYGDTSTFGRQVLISGTLGLNNDSGNIGIGFHRGTSNTYGYIGTGAWAVNGLANDDFGIASGPTGDLAFGTGSGSPERLRITSGGKVGINTTDNTTADLQIRTATNFNGILRIGGNAGTAVGLDITYNNGGATSTIFKQNYRSTNDAALMEFDSGCVAFKTGTGGEERLRIKGNGTIQFTPEGSSTNPNASFDTSGDFFRLNAKKDGSGGCGLVFQTQSNGALSEGMRITDAGIVNTRRHATGNMNAGVAYAPHQYGYIGDYIHYGCNHLFYLATTSTSNTGYSSHMFSWYDSGHWGHYGKLFLFCQEVGYVGGMCHRFLSGTGVTTIFGVGQVSGASTTQTLIGTGTHSGQSVHRYDCTVSHSGTYRSVRWYLGMSNGCILGVTGSGKTQAQADTYASSNGSMLHLFGVSDSNLTMAPNYRTW